MRRARFRRRANKRSLVLRFVYHLSFKAGSMQSSMLSTDPDHGVVNPALEAFVESESWQIEEIKRGLAEADAGEFATDAEVAAHPGSLTIASAPMRLR